MDLPSTAGRPSVIADLVQLDAAAYLDALAQGARQDARALALADVDRPADSGAETDARRARCLVLLDAVVGREHARADQAGFLVEPGPDLYGAATVRRALQR